MQSCTRTNWMSAMSRSVSSLISRRSASSDGSPHFTLPPGMPQRFDHFCVRIIKTSPASSKMSAPTDDGWMRFLELLWLRADVQFVGFKDFAQLAEVFDD